MGATRRKFTLEFRIEAAHRVIDTGRSVREVANELSVLENSLSKWVRDERRRLDAVAGTSEEPLTPCGDPISGPEQLRVVAGFAASIAP